MTTPIEAGLAILSEVPGSALHWTVIWDRALRGGLINPMEDPDARDALIKGLSEAARDGTIERTSKGTYRAKPLEGA